MATSFRNFTITHHDADDVEKLVNELTTDPEYNRGKRRETVAVFRKVSSYWTFKKTTPSFEMTIYVAFVFTPHPSGGLSFHSTIFTRSSLGHEPSEDLQQACFLHAKCAANVPCVRSLSMYLFHCRTACHYCPMVGF